MSDKIVYLYDKNTHKFSGQEFAYESAAKPGEFIVPVNGTLIAPPESQDGYDIVFTDNKWRLVKNEEPIVSEKDKKIFELKQKLDETDYQVLKNMEAFLINNPLPYDMEKLHNNRQSWRNQIKQLEAQNGK